MNNSRCLLLIKQIMFSLLMSLTLISCEMVDPCMIDIDESSLVGEWLLSTSDNEKQTVFQIKENPFDLWVEIRKNNSKILGFGSRFSVSRGVISGRYATQYKEFQDTELVEFSWKVKEKLPLEIVVEETSEKGNVPISLHRLTGELNLECLTNIKPDYTSMTGVTRFLEFRILDSSVAEIDPNTGELWLGENPGYTYILVSTTSGTCAITLNVHRSNQGSFSGELWCCDLPSERRWVRMILYSDDEGKVMVHRSDYGKSFVMYEKLTGNFDKEGEDISLTLTGNTMPKPELHNLKLMTRSESEIKVDKVESGKEPMIFRRVLKTNLISPGERFRTNFKLILGGADIRGFKSHDESIVSVDATGEITGVSEGITFIDVITEQGNFLLEVDVDGGIIPYPFEEVFSTEDPEYLTMNFNPYCHPNLGELDPLSITHTTRRYINIRPIIKWQIDSQTRFGGPLCAITVVYIESITGEEVIRALDERYTKLETDTNQKTITYINSKELSDATVKIIIRLESKIYGPNIVVVYQSLKKDIWYKP